MAAMVVGVGAAAGWAGSSRATTKAVVTPIATASTPATATRRMWAGRIADPPVDAPCWSGRLPDSPLPVTKPDRRHLGHVPDRSPPISVRRARPVYASGSRLPIDRVKEHAAGRHDCLSNGEPGAMTESRLAPEEVRTRTFTRVVRGYRRSEVRRLLERAAADLARLRNGLPASAARTTCHPSPPGGRGGPLPARPRRLRDGRGRRVPRPARGRARTRRPRAPPPLLRPPGPTRQAAFPAAGPGPASGRVPGRGSRPCSGPVLAPGPLSAPAPGRAARARAALAPAGGRRRSPRPPGPCRRATDPAAPPDPGRAARRPPGRARSRPPGRCPRRPPPPGRQEPGPGGRAAGAGTAAHGRGVLPAGVGAAVGRPRRRRPQPRPWPRGRRPRRRRGR